MNAGDAALGIRCRKSPPRVAAGSGGRSRLAFRVRARLRERSSSARRVELSTIAYPDAPETQAARVSLGRLLLDRQGDA